MTCTLAGFLKNLQAMAGQERGDFKNVDVNELIYHLVYRLYGD
jgi:hypothetical protein